MKEQYNKLKIEKGQIFGRLMIFEEKESINYVRRFECICECGTRKIVRLNKLTAKLTTSCGCYHKDIAKQVNTKHNDRYKSSPHHYLYYTWNGAKGRCYNPNNSRYNTYGKLGITMYNEWKDDYIKFKTYILSNLGERPVNHSLDRIDNNKGYEPNNLKWSTSLEQRKNQRRNERYKI